MTNRRTLTRRGLPAPVRHSKPLVPAERLLGDIRGLIEQARERLARERQEGETDEKPAVPRLTRRPAKKPRSRR